MIPCLTVGVGSIVHYHEEESGSTRGALHIDGKLRGMSKFQLGEVSEYTAEVLAMSAGSPSRWKLRYQTRLAVDLNGDKVHLPVEGKAYLVDAEHVTKEDGKAPAPLEAFIVTGEGQLPKKREALLGCGVPLHRDERVVAPGGDLAAANEFGFHAGAVTYRGLTGDRATVDFTWAVRKATPLGTAMLAIDYDLEGKLLLDRHGHGLEIEATGPARVTGSVVEKGHTIAVNASGPIEMRVKISVDPAL